MTAPKPPGAAEVSDAARSTVRRKVLWPSWMSISAVTLLLAAGPEVRPTTVCPRTVFQFEFEDRPRERERTSNLFPFLTGAMK